jgi:HAD superfamily hydrolase (TIGR01509 family)
MTERPVLLCDVMDTLVYNPFNREIPAFFGLSHAELARCKHPSAWADFERGELDEREYLRQSFADCRSFDHAAFKEMMRQAYRWIDGAEHLLKCLRGEGFEIHALSNYPIWYRTIEAELGLSRYLHWTFVSCRTGVRKPDPAAYWGAARALGREPGACLFIDDNLQNCRAAEAIGMPSIHFRDTDMLWAELVQRQIVRVHPSPRPASGS